MEATLGPRQRRLPQAVPRGNVFHRESPQRGSGRVPPKTYESTLVSHVALRVDRRGHVSSEVATLSSYVDCVLASDVACHVISLEGILGLRCSLQHMDVPVDILRGLVVLIMTPEWTSGMWNVM